MKAVQVTSKSSLIHVIGNQFKVNVEFLDRRWWELRPRMRVTIPVENDYQMIKVQGRVLDQIILRGYSPGIDMRMVNVES